MKRKDLKAYIRTEIINELSEGPATDAAKDAGVTNPAAAATNARQAAQKDKSGTSTIVGPKGSKVIDKNTPLEEVDIDEMARKAGGYRIGDTAKFAEAKELYSNGLYADILNAIEAAGEDGIAQKDLGIKLGFRDSDLNNPLNVLKNSGILGGGKLARIEKPGKDSEDETEPDEFKDLYSVDVEDETPEEEKPTSIANDKELAALTGDDITGDDDVTGKSDEANKAINTVKKISDKIKDMKNGLERDRKIAALKQYISNNKTLLKGRDISVLTSGILGGEI